MAATLFRAVAVAVILLLQFLTVVLCSFPATLTLERAFPTNHNVQLSQLRARDRVRHGRMLSGVVEFPIGGTFNPYLVGLYFTSVKLGTPATEFYVQIDTGSDALWVGCNSCSGCPQSSGLKIQLHTFDPQSSPTASVVSCSDKICTLGLDTQDSSCDSQNKRCSYTFQYGDGSGTSGYYVSDLLHFDTAAGNQSATSNSSASIVFGCSTSASGVLQKTDRAVDGIFGFGQQEMSVISQLSSQGIAPKAFSHCFKGDDTGGGIMVLGEIVEPNIVYTPLVQNQPHYNLNLESISVGGQTLPIDQSVFATSSNQGTIVDSGTTLAYLAQDAYDPFVNAITSAVSQSVTPVSSQGEQCYIVTSSITDTFPQVSLNFAGNASMILRPQDYLLQQNSAGDAQGWCIGIQKSDGQDITVLGDLVLKDKIIVYDLANQRIGWVQYNCSMSVSVSSNTSTGTASVNGGSIDVNDNSSSSLRNDPFKLIPISMMFAFLVHIYINH
ncbi:aspartic proteinase 36-like [Rosa rugosa]|uniref:aspartic proteinase 36-like n=1 Tax=Rosa rugosa TaxID=74645 RepID=UPI002B405DBA|nr:aspartic proteinase 36-like [Rosa rugosa]